MAIVNGKKRCPECQTNKPTESFYISNTKGDGFASYCKMCSIKRNTIHNHTKAALLADNQRLLTENNLFKELFTLKPSPTLKDESAASTPVLGQGSADAGEGEG